LGGLIVDNFAGGGGASTGIEQALGRAVDIAINHDEQALRMHEVNHPSTRHIRNNIWQIDPVEVTGGNPVSLAWFSPDCKHFSKAKGGKPREKSIRDLAWVVVLWGKRVKPDVILLENVEEFRTWGPLDDQGSPIKARAGETFDKWCRELRRLGYKLQFRELRACDYGAPTIRKRFFMIARRDGRPIVWPAPTHGKPASPGVVAGTLRPWRTAAEIIDWSIPCPSIFERKKELAEKTKRRIAHGTVKFVLRNPAPFIVPVKTWGGGGNNPRSSDEPMRTTTTSKGGEHAVVTPFVAPVTHGGSQERSYSPTQPLHTVTGANRGEIAAVAPLFARTAHGDVDRKGKRRGQGAHSTEEPFPTIATSQDSALVAAHITKFRSGATGHAADEPLATVTANSFIKRPGGSAPLGAVAAHLERMHGKSRGAAADEPAPTITAGGGGKTAAVATFLSPYYGDNDGGRVRSGNPADEPLRTSTVENRFGAVAAFLSHQYGSATNGGQGDPERPLKTITTGGHHAIVCAHIEQANGSPEGEKPLPGRKADDPLSTIVAKGCTQRVIETTLVGPDALPPDLLGRAVRTAAFLIKYYGNESDGHGLDAPIGTVTVQDRFAVVMVLIDAETYILVDIGVRMLTPRELFNAQGFPPDYIIDRDAEGRPITKTAQVAKCGNSVCPPVAAALVRANFGSALLAAEVEAA
jgi:DNA (cytosine-5)-methyltransferase 1